MTALPRHARIGHPALIVHVFAQMDRVRAGSPEQQRQPAELWSRLERLNMTASLSPSLPTALPDDLVPSARTERIAARCCPHQPPCRQAIAWTRQDAFGISVALAAEPDLPWDRLLSEWHAAVTPGLAPVDGSSGPQTTLPGPPSSPRLPFPPQGFLQAVYVHRGVSRIADAPDADLNLAVSRLSHTLRLHPADRPGPWTRTAEGIVAWEVAPPGEPARTRTLIALTSGPERVLDDWCWYSGSAEPAPLTLHLLHAARLHDQYAVVAASQDRQHDLDHRAREAANALSSLHRATGHSTVDDLLTANDLAASLAVTVRDLAAMAADLRTAGRAVEAVNSALASTEISGPAASAAATGPPVPAASHRRSRSRPSAPKPPSEPPGSPFAADRALGTALTARINDQAFYLEQAAGRAAAVLAQMNAFVEQGLRARQQQLTLIQTSVISAALMMLAAVQSFGYRIPIAGPIRPALIAVLAALALMLPTAILRLSHAGARAAPFTAFDMLAITLCGAATGWLTASCFWEIRWDDPAPTAWSLAMAAIGGALSGALGCWRLVLLRRPATSRGS